MKNGKNTLFKKDKQVGKKYEYHKRDTLEVRDKQGQSRQKRKGIKENTQGTKRGIEGKKRDRQKVMFETEWEAQKKNGGGERERESRGMHQERGTN